MEQVNRDEITLFIQNNENFYKRKFKKWITQGKACLGTGQHFSWVYTGWYTEKCTLKQVHFYY